MDSLITNRLKNHSPSLIASLSASCILNGTCCSEFNMSIVDPSAWIPRHAVIFNVRIKWSGSWLNLVVNNSATPSLIMSISMISWSQTQRRDWTENPSIPFWTRHAVIEQKIRIQKMSVSKRHSIHCRKFKWWDIRGLHQESSLTLGLHATYEPGEAVSYYDENQLASLTSPRLHHESNKKCINQLSSANKAAPPPTHDCPWAWFIQ